LLAKSRESNPSTDMPYTHHMGSDMQEILKVHQPFAMLHRERPESPAGIEALREVFFVEVTAQYSMPYNVVRGDKGTYKPNDDMELRRMYQVATSWAELLERRVNDVLRVMWAMPETIPPVHDMRTWRESSLPGGTRMRATPAGGNEKYQHNLDAIFEGRRAMQTDTLTDEVLGIDANMKREVCYSVAHIMKLSHLLPPFGAPVSATGSEDPVYQAADKSSTKSAQTRPQTPEPKNKVCVAPPASSGQNKRMQGVAGAGGVGDASTANGADDIDNSSDSSDSGSDTGTTSDVSPTTRTEHKRSMSREVTKSRRQRQNTLPPPKDIPKKVQTPTEEPKAGAVRTDVLGFLRERSTDNTNQLVAHKHARNDLYPQATPQPGKLSHSRVIPGCTRKDLQRLEDQVEAVLTVTRAQRRKEKFWQEHLLSHAQSMIGIQSQQRNGHSSLGPKSGSSAPATSVSVHDDPRHIAMSNTEHTGGLYVTMLLMVDNRRMNTVDFTRAQTEKTLVHVEFLRAQRLLEDLEEGREDTTVSHTTVNTANETPPGPGAPALQVSSSVSSKRGTDKHLEVGATLGKDALILKNGNYLGLDGDSKKDSTTDANATTEVQTHTTNKRDTSARRRTPHMPSDQPDTNMRTDTSPPNSLLDPNSEPRGSQDGLGRVMVPTEDLAAFRNWERKQRLAPQHTSKVATSASPALRKDGATVSPAAVAPPSRRREDAAPRKGKKRKGAPAHSPREQLNRKLLLARRSS
jgi:hypothetical protein